MLYRLTDRISYNGRVTSHSWWIDYECVAEPPKNFPVDRTPEGKWSHYEEVEPFKVQPAPWPGKWCPSKDKPLLEKVPGNDLLQWVIDLAEKNRSLEDDLEILGKSQFLDKSDDTPLTDLIDKELRLTWEEKYTYFATNALQAKSKESRTRWAQEFQKTRQDWELLPKNPKRKRKPCWTHLLLGDLISQVLHERLDP